LTQSIIQQVTLGRKFSRSRPGGGIKAESDGAPRGKQNARKHGHYTREAIAKRPQFGELLRQSRAVIAEMK
jgi:hypothetical protein